MLKGFEFNYLDKVALINEGGACITYGEIKAFYANMRAHLLPRSLIFVLCTNTPGSLCGYLSFLENRAVALMLDASKGDDMVRALLDIYHPNYLWMPSTRNNLFLPGEVVFSQLGYSLVCLHTDIVKMNDDLDLLLTTSGSTGDPKLVRLSRNNLRSNAESIAKYLEITQEERPVTSLPMYYSFGLSVINSHLMKGATILLTDKSVMQKEFWTFVKEQKASSFSGVPYTYEMLKRLRVFRMDLPYLKTMTQAGGKLNPDLVREYVEHAKQAGRKFIVMYGQTEATARMSYLPFEFAEEKYASIGMAIPGGEFKLVDSDDAEILAPNVDGELVYCGANVSLGYAVCLEDLTKGDVNHGILHTGDIARRDEDGFYYIVGRKKRFLKIFGNRVNLDETERMIKDAFPDLNCACAGIDDQMYIFITNEKKASEIRSYVAEKTQLNQSAFKTVVIDSIPKNAAGKILYASLTKYYDGLQ